MVDQMTSRRYPVTIEPDEDGWWTVSADDVPGAHSHGQTIERAKANIKEAIAMMEELPEGAEETMELAVRVVLPPASDEAVRAASLARDTYELASRELSSATSHALEVLAKEFPDMGSRDIAALLGISFQRVTQLRPGRPKGGRKARAS